MTTTMNTLHSHSTNGLWLGLLLFIPVISDAQSVGAISQYAITSPDPRPWAITTGPDGALWFTESKGTNIGRITTAGIITEYPLSASDCLGIIAGPDGALWFTEVGNGAFGGKIGRITTAGAITEYPVPPPLTEPTDITVGPDGALWFTGFGGPYIGRITTAGAITEYTIASSTRGPQGITTGPDGALWFAELAGNRIGRITIAGVVTEYAVPTPNSSPWYITTGPDGALWFTEGTANKIGRITTAGVFTEYALPTQDQTHPLGIITGPDGALWFTESGDGLNKIGRITTRGAITEYVVPTTDDSEVMEVKTGPDGALWFTEAVGNKIGRVTLTSGRASMAQLASGGGWTTTLTLVNTGASPTGATLKFFDNSGNPLQLPLTFPQGFLNPVTTATFTGTLNAGAEMVIQSAGSISQPTQVGWAQILTSGSISGFAVFSATTGNSLQEATVPLEDRTPGAFVVSFDSTGNYVTGVALANLVANSENIGIVIRDDTGAVLLTDFIALPAQGHTSFVLATNYPVTAQRRGTVEFDTPPNGQISVLGLRFNPTGAFSSIPVSAE